MGECSSLLIISSLSMCMSDITYKSNLDSLTYVAFDVETTGLSAVAQKLVELSGVKFNPLSHEVETFSRLINPEIPIPREVTNIHGIDDKMVKGKPTVRQVVPEFLDWIGFNSVLIAHNAPFDLDFMRVNVARLGLECPTNYVIDTLVLSRECLPEAPRHQLKTVVETLNLPSGGYHRALADSVHVKDVFLTLIKASNLTLFEHLCALGAVTTFNFDQYKDQVIESMSERDRENMTLLEKAIADSSTLEITYNGAVMTTRRIRPISLVHSRGQIYLTAYCNTVRAERTFRVDRIGKLIGTSAK